jgi:hypothetical protein
MLVIIWEITSFPRVLVKDSEDLSSSTAVQLRVLKHLVGALMSGCGWLSYPMVPSLLPGQGMAKPGGHMCAPAHGDGGASGVCGGMQGALFASAES